MLDIGKEKLEFACENCGKKVTIRLEQAAREEKVKCKNCGVCIQLKDNGSVKKGVRDFDRSLKNLEKAFKKLGN